MFQRGSFTAGAKPVLRGLRRFKKVINTLLKFPVQPISWFLCLLQLCNKSYSLCPRRNIWYTLVNCDPPIYPDKGVKKKLPQAWKTLFKGNPVFDLFNPQKTKKSFLVISWAFTNSFLTNEHQQDYYYKKHQLRVMFISVINWTRNQWMANNFPG